MQDRTILYMGAFIRALATGMGGILIGVYLARLQLSPFTAGLVVASGMAGGAGATLAVTLAADRVGRRRMLIGLSIIASIGGLAFAAAPDRPLLLLSAFAGMLNGMGRDRGAMVALDQAVLPATVSNESRTGSFARYNVLQDIGHAIGSLIGGMPAVLAQADYGEVAAVRWSFVLYASFMLLPALLYASLSPRVEVPSERRVHLSAGSRRIVWKISSLFGLDAIGGGFLTAALVSYFFFERFGTSEGLIAILFFAARIANLVSYVAAARLARRFGLLNTMVFTHIPSSVILMMVALAPNFLIAAVLFLIREAFVEMDVPTRQSYVVAIVRPEERTTVSGVTHLVRLGGWAAGPTLAGTIMEGFSLAAPLITGGAIKIVYDLALYASFRRIRPPEEVRA